MAKNKRYRDEFNSLLYDDPDFNYSSNEFNEWLSDMGLKNKIKKKLKGGKK